MTIFGFVTTRSSHDYTDVALESFFRFTPVSPEDEVVLIDNDNSYPRADLWSSRCTILINQKPRGFSANGNVLLRRSLERHTDLIYANNDIFFTKGWYCDRIKETPVLISPLSNQQVQYATSVSIPATNELKDLFLTGGTMRRDQYVNNPWIFEYIAAVHQRTTADLLWRLMVVPFFCIKIPLEIATKLGGFDEQFGRGGGEDYDYCLRAYLAGYEVNYALQSYIFHFGGKSSWSSHDDANSLEAQQSEAERERVIHFKSYFASKWGEDLLEVILHEKYDLLKEKYGLNELSTSDSLTRCIKHIASAGRSTVPSIHIAL
jgi:GT2 family glycosyltransferase